MDDGAELKRLQARWLAFKAQVPLLREGQTFVYPDDMVELLRNVSVKHGEISK